MGSKKKKSTRKSTGPIETEVRSHGDKWAVCLKQEHCETDEPVIYGVTTRQDAASIISQRFNDNAREAAEWEAEEKERVRQERAEKETGRGRS